MSKRQVYDCFTFFNELDLLEIRLNILDKYVDKFVISEATLTHNYKAKPLYFADNKERFKHFKDKIIHIIVDTAPESDDSWAMETHQRNELKKGLVNCNSDDIVIISDLDEVPNPQAIKNKKQNGIQSLQQKMYRYYINGLESDSWFHPKIMFYQDTIDSLDNVNDLYGEYLPEKNNQGTTLSKIRVSKAPVVKNGGWHFTSLGGIDKVMQKLSAFAHQEQNTDGYRNIENLKNLIENMKYVKIDRSFPEYIRENQDKYAHLIHESNTKNKLVTFFKFYFQKRA